MSKIKAKISTACWLVGRMIGWMDGGRDGERERSKEGRTNAQMKVVYKCGY